MFFKAIIQGVYMKKKIISLLYVLGFFLLCLPTFTFGQIVHHEKLELVRENIVFPDLTDEEKQLVGDQAQILLKDLYVHRYAKMNYYFNHEDPVHAIEDVVNHVTEMTTAEMEEKIYRIFAAQRDLHLNYNFPSPYRDYKSFLPVTFTRTAGRGNYFQVRVSAVNEELFTEFAPGMRVPEVGDELIIYNKQSIWQAVKERLPLSMGANFYGGFTRVLGIMTYLNHKRYLVPEENEVTLVLKPYGKRHHRKYKITLPWIAEWTEEEPTRMMRQMDKKEDRFSPKLLDLAVDDWQKEYNSFLKQNNLEPISAFPSNPSGEPTLTWGIIDNKRGHFGYLRLESFVPANGVDFTVSEVRRLLIEELADTDGLIFDVRNNGGGYISLADMLPQLFKKTDAEVLKSRLLNTDLNNRIFNESVLGELLEPEWKQVVNDAAGTGNTYTEGAVFTYDNQANGMGQAYYKPVAVLSNARSYSATDMFTSAMQDNVAALIYGEDPTTGAGGANVIEHGFFNYYVPNEFEALPGNHEMRVSWRQTVRFGQNEGDIIEDYGCYADKDVSQTAKDVVTGGDVQIAKLTKSLAKRSRFYRASARGIQNSHELYLSVNDLNYGLHVKNTAYVSVSINGEIHEKIPVFAYHREKYIEVDLSSELAEGEVASIKFEGQTYHGKALWNLKRRVIVLGDQVIVNSEGFEIDFAEVSTVYPITVINNNLPEDGWNLVDSYLQIGYAPNYKDYVDTDAVLFVDLTETVNPQLSVGLGYDTELDWDFIQVYVTHEDADTVLFAGSGYQAMTDYTFDLTAFAGKKDVIVHFRFTSDSNTNAPGVKMSRVSINEQ